MKITFLGTSSGTPTRTRNVTSQALSLDHGALWLLDCGEATQHQLMRAGLKASRIERILLTHLHGDHSFGLPGVLACMSIHERRDPVHIVGPVGVRELVETTLRITDSALSFPLDFTELSAARDLGGQSGWSISAHPLVHRVPCFGYSLREAPRPGRFDAAQAAAVGVPWGALRGRLQHGEDVQLPDGRTVRAAEVCGAPRPGRHVVLLGDTNDASGIAAAAHGCDLLVREATYDHTRTEKAAQWGHSTTTMTGRFAAEVGARHLIITHFSSRFTDEPERGQKHIAELLAETQGECPHTRVWAADDLWSFAVPFPDEASEVAPPPVAP